MIIRRDILLKNARAEFEKEKNETSMERVAQLLIQGHAAVSEIQEKVNVIATDGTYGVV